MTTKIEWAEETWNPTTGCDKTSPGCDNCYALGMAKRLKAMGQAKYQADGDPRTSGPGFALTVHPDTLTLPLRWKTPRRVFVNSMSDLFHQDVPDQFIADVFAVMAATHWHTFQILTKRSKRMRDLLTTHHFADLVEEILTESDELCTAADDGYGDGHTDHFDAGWLWPLRSSADAEVKTGLDQVWLGVSVESAKYRFRLDHLRETPAAVRWVSFEPLLGPLGDLDLTGIDWVVVGGESGQGARPMHPDWAREIRDQCIDQGVAFFFKQWGNWRPAQITDEHRDTWLSADGSTHAERSGTADLPMVRERSKNFDGHDLLDGQQWHQYPESVS